VVPIRGSSSRGGGEALLQLIDLAKHGYQIGFTPDGPRGPAHTVHGGIITAAQVSGAPIVPLSGKSRRKIVFNSWDKFELPLPFSVNVVAHGTPFTIDKEMSLDAAANLVRDKINQNSAAAQKRLDDAGGWFSMFIGNVLYSAYVGLGFLLSPLVLFGAMFKYGFGRTLKGLSERVGVVSREKFMSGGLWLHAASIGEWQALKPIVTRLEKENTQFHVTVSTPEAKELIKKQSPTLRVTLLPVDVPLVIRRWLRRLRPRALIIIETELWPVLINKLYQENIPVVIANGRLSNKSVHGWQALRPFAERLLGQITHYYVRSEVDRRNFEKIGAPAERITITGNTKSDNLSIINLTEKNEYRRRLVGDYDGVIVVAGSTWPGEENMIVELARQIDGGQARFIIAPRRKERLEKILKDSGHSWSRWSEIKDKTLWATDALLVDTFGDLASLYQAADVAFIGGSVYPKGGQNPLEAAAARAAVIFGPSMENFLDEAAKLVQNGGALQGSDSKSLLNLMDRLIRDESFRRETAAKAATAAQESQGAAGAVVSYLKEVFL
jgi:3-deoxy-D-manno-octulosonic-acid transferase